MSTARDLLLEIKRQIGDVNASVPNETDLLAFLNRALGGLWNYGARLNSPVLYKYELFTSENGSIPIPGGIMRVKSVADHDTGCRILAVPLDYAVAMSGRMDEKNRRYVLSPTKIDIYPLNIPILADVIYMPYFTRLTSRDANLPFPPELDNAILNMTVGLISGKDTDMIMASAPYGNAVSRFFRGRGCNAIVGHGPW